MLWDNASVKLLTTRPSFWNLSISSFDGESKKQTYLTWYLFLLKKLYRLFIKFLVVKSKVPSQIFKI